MLLDQDLPWFARRSFSRLSGRERHLGAPGRSRSSPTAASTSGQRGLRKVRWRGSQRRRRLRLTGLAKITVTKCPQCQRHTQGVRRRQFAAADPAGTLAATRAVPYSVEAASSRSIAEAGFPASGR